MFTGLSVIFLQLYALKSGNKQVSDTQKNRLKAFICFETGVIKIITRGTTQIADIKSATSSKSDNFYALT